MCGIAGYLLKRPRRRATPILHELLASIRHRGPDDEGLCLISRQKKTLRLFRANRTVSELSDRLPHFQDHEPKAAHDVALLHTRYSILDLSPQSHQPFVSNDGSIVAVFNGEIYNYLELRKELQDHGVPLKTSGDTEIFVEAYRLWRDSVWGKLNGFWAAALYDSRTSTLVLSRDRVGVAPLYYRELNDGFYFASSIQPLIDIRPMGLTLDREILSGFIDTSLKDFNGRTCYKQIHSIPSATTVCFEAHASALNQARQTTYWRVPTQRWSKADLPFTEAVQRYRDTFLDAVKIRLRADVKVAFELSGGLDSSSIVAAAALLRANRITSYTIAVPEQNEEPFARAILDRYPIDHRILSGTEEGFFDEQETFTRLMEEPYHSPNIFTHFKMRQRMKADGVAAVLSGSGGDEVLAGYAGDFWPTAATELRRNGQYAHVLFHDLAKRFGSPRDLVRSLQKSSRRAREGVRRLSRWASNAGRRGPLSQGRVGRYAFSCHEQPDTEAAAIRLQRSYTTMTYDQRRQFHFQVGLLPYYLRSNDHFTMAIPLEHRFPFLDYRMVELGVQMPVPYLFKNGWTKYVLRKAMEPFLPKKILWRREKMGFPFALRKFLATHRSRLERAMEVAAGVQRGRTPAYSSLLQDDPYHLWRLCSTGLWLEQSSLPMP